MTEAQIHLVFNHFPLVICFVALLILGYGVLKNNTILIRTAFILNIAVLLFTVPLYVTGEGAEEIVEQMEHVSHDYIHEHEEMAEKAFVVAILLAIISIAGLFNFPKKFSGTLPKVILGFTILSFIMFASTAHFGGRISHPELREDFKPVEGHENASEENH